MPSFLDKLLSLFRFMLPAAAATPAAAVPTRSAMRLESDDEVTSWFQENDCCPDCGGQDFAPGPRGGLAQNMQCRGCGAEFNIARFEGRIFLAARIDRSGPDRGLVSVPDPRPPRILH